MRARTVALRLISTVSIVTVLSMIGASTSSAQAKPGSLGNRASDALKASSDDKPTAVATKPTTSKTTSEPAAKPKSARSSKPAKAKASKPANDKPAKPAKPPKPKKQVSPAEAVGLSREILVKHGYQVVRVESLKDSEVIYYRAGNNGRGRGQGALRKMIVRPYGNIVTFEAAPERVRSDIRMHLGF